MRVQAIVVATLIGALAGCGDDVVRVFPLNPAPHLPHGHSKLVGSSLLIEMEDAESLVSGYRWVAWAKSDDGTEALGEIKNGAHLELDASKLATEAAAIETILITEEKAGAALPTAPSSRIWMQGEFPGALHALGIEDAAFAAAKAEVHIESSHIMLTASGLPKLPAGFIYAAWLTFEAPHDETAEQHGAEQHGAAEGAAQTPMPQSLGTIAGGTSLEKDLATVPFHADGAMVTIESEKGIAMMSSAMVLHGKVLLTAQQQGSAPPAEPPGHTH